MLLYESKPEHECYTPMFGRLSVSYRQIRICLNFFFYVRNLLQSLGQIIFFLNMADFFQDV